MAENLKARLLPPRPSTPPGVGGDNPTDVGLKNRSNLVLKRPLFQGMDMVGLKKRGHGVRSWIRIDPAGNSQILEVDKTSLMRRCDLPARDLRLLDPLFVYPSTILGRERAIVVNLERIRCIITADEVLLLNSLDNVVLQYVSELQGRLGYKLRALQLLKPDEQDRKRALSDGDMFSGSSADDLPFEFRALEVALEFACSYLDAQVCRCLNPNSFLLCHLLSHPFQFFSPKLAVDRLFDCCPQSSTSRISGVAGPNSPILHLSMKL